MNVIEMQGITKRYGTVDALCGVDLQVQPGEVVGFLGPNGAGKTTAISIMLGLRTATSGTTRLWGTSPSDPAAKARTGVMLQESGVPETLRVQEVVRLFQSYYPYTLPTDEIIQRAGLQDKRRTLIDKLSGGQKQRLYFALALTGDPDLLFLDEPSVGMDVETRHAFWEQVRGFAAAGKTILFSTHYLQEADALASRIVVINKGEIIAQGTPREIKAHVADTHVRMRTDLPLDQIHNYPSVRRVTTENGYVTVTTNEPEQFLRRVFLDDWQVADLSVQQADLETAFLSLTEGAAA
jgi:ABC-2 type transport system ATP-binding protein